MRSGERRLGGAGAGHQGGDARHDGHGAAAGQAPIEIDEGAVEEGIALAEHGHAPSCGDLLQDLFRRGIIDIRLGKAAVAQRHADGDLPLPAGKMRGDDAAREALALLRRRIGDHLGGADQAQRLQRQELRIAGPDADAPDPGTIAAAHGFTDRPLGDGHQRAPARGGSRPARPGRWRCASACRRARRDAGRRRSRLPPSPHWRPAARRLGSAAQQRSTKPWVATPPPMNMASGEARSRQRLWRLPGDDLDLRRAERARILGDERPALGIAFDGDRLHIPPGTQPFDRDGSAAGADIPEPLPWKGRERGQGRRANLALGELPVMTEGVVGQPGQTGKTLDAGIGDAFDGKGVEIGCPRRGPRLCRRFEDPLLPRRPYARGGSDGS